MIANIPMYLYAVFLPFMLKIGTAVCHKIIPIEKQCALTVW